MPVPNYGLALASGHTKMVIMTRTDKGPTDQETKELSENMSEQKCSRSGFNIMKIWHSETPHLNSKWDASAAATRRVNVSSSGIIMPGHEDVLPDAQSWHFSIILNLDLKIRTSPRILKNSQFQNSKNSKKSQKLPYRNSLLLKVGCVLGPTKINW